MFKHVFEFLAPINPNLRFWHMRSLPCLRRHKPRSKAKVLLKIFASTVIADIQASRRISQNGLQADLRCGSVV